MGINLTESQIEIFKNPKFINMIQEKLIEIEDCEKHFVHMNSISAGYSQCSEKVFDAIAEQKESIRRALDNIEETICCLFENVNTYGCYSKKYGKIMFIICCSYPCKENPKKRNHKAIHIYPHNIWEEIKQEDYDDDDLPF